MDMSELELFFKEDSFHPFVITLLDGYALPIERVGQALLGLTMIVARDPKSGHLIHIPFHAIAHISQKGSQL